MQGGVGGYIRASAGNRCKVHTLASF
jgi:hypothetical protein